MFHIFVNVAALPILRAVSEVKKMPKFDPYMYAESLERHKSTTLHVATPIISFLANNEKVRPDHLESIKSCFVSATPVGEAIAYKFLKKAQNVDFREVWGITELTGCWATPKNNAQIGSCGVLLPKTENKIVDLERGEGFGPNQRGELCIKGLQVMKGYINDPKSTDETIKKEWLYSGDMAY